MKTSVHSALGGRLLGLGLGFLDVVLSSYIMGFLLWSLLSGISVRRVPGHPSFLSYQRLVSVPTNGNICTSDLTSPRNPSGSLGLLTRPSCPLLQSPHSKKHLPLSIQQPSLSCSLLGFAYCVVLLRHGITLQLTLLQNPVCSPGCPRTCLSFPHAGVTNVRHCAWRLAFFSEIWLNMPDLPIFPLFSSSVHRITYH